MNFNKIAHQVNQHKSNYNKGTWNTIEARIRRDKRRNFMVILVI